MEWQPYPVNSAYFIWSLELTLAASFCWSAEVLVNNVVEPTKWSESKHLPAYILARCTARVPCLLLLAGFAVRSLLAKLLCHLDSMKEENFWEYSCNWHQLRTLGKYLGRRDWEEYCFFLIFHIVPLYLFEHVAGHTSYAVKLLDIPGQSFFRPLG